MTYKKSHVRAATDDYDTRAGLQAPAAPLKRSALRRGRMQNANDDGSGEEVRKDKVRHRGLVKNTAVFW